MVFFTKTITGYDFYTFAEITGDFNVSVYIGDTCTTSVKITENLNEEKGIYKLDTKVVKQDGTVVSDGYAVVKY